MKPRNVLLSLLLVCGLLAWAMVQSRQQRAREALGRNPANLRFTTAALCHLRCMGLQTADAQQVLTGGLVLFHKSNRRAAPCPVWVIQGETRSGATCRLRLEQCGNNLLVVKAEKPGVPVSCTCSDAPPGEIKAG